METKFFCKLSRLLLVLSELLVFNWGSLLIYGEPKLPNKYE